MINYEFEKGVIKTGVAIDLGTNDTKFFEDTFGRFIKHYDDGKHTKEGLEPVYAFMKILEDDSCELILTKEENEILSMKKSDKYELADMDFVLAMSEGNTPINFYCLDGLCTLTEEEYLEHGRKVNKSNYINITWM